MQEAEKKTESGKDIQTDVAEENLSAVQTEDGIKRQVSGNSKVKADIPKEMCIRDSSYSVLAGDLLKMLGRTLKELEDMTE